VAKIADDKLSLTVAIFAPDAAAPAAPRLARSIREAFALGRYSAYRMALRERFLGRGLAHGEGYPDWTLRLFHRAHASWSNDLVHEAVLTTAEVGRLEGDLLRDSGDDIATRVLRHHRRTSLHARGAR
jgi:hypothetical protein